MGAFAARSGVVAYRGEKAGSAKERKMDTRNGTAGSGTPSAKGDSASTLIADRLV